MQHNNTSAQRGNAILILVAMVLGVLIGLMFARNINHTESRTTLQGKMGEVMELIEGEYVDDVDADSVGERVLAAMLRELDPHSTYLSPRETQRTDEMMRGSFEGVGLVLHREGDTTFVGQVLPDGPSAGLGIMPGDMLLCIDADTVSGRGMAADSVVARLRGPRRSQVTVQVLRYENGTLQPHTYTIRRGVVPHHTLLYSTMLDPTTGYVMLGSFSSTSHDEFCTAVRSLKQQGMQRLILDLRGNGGGSLNSAIGIAEELLTRGSLIVYTQGTHTKRHNVYAQGGGLFDKGQVVVLVDENSASASEVVSGALQDNDRATIVGRRTFGKGLVQTEFTLDDGSAILLTTARYYTPSGRCIQRTYAAGTDEYYRDYYNQLLNETYADSIAMHIADSTPYHTVGGRTVYGGGGIMPDVVLPLRKDSTLVYYNQLSQRGLIARTAFAYVKHHATELSARYTTVADFERGFSVEPALIEQLVHSGEALGIKRNNASLKQQRPLIAAMLKANIGMALFGDAGFYSTYINHDDDIQRALDIK